MVTKRSLVSEVVRSYTKMLLLWYIFSTCLFMATEVFVDGRPEGFHFTRFSGPVSGPVSQVEISQLPHLRAPVHGHKPTFDYVAKPDYSFAYGVQDPESGNYQNQKETRDGDVVKGEYTVIDADGTTRRVVYTADPKHGFQATVHLSEPNKEHAARQENFVKNLALENAANELKAY